MGNSKFIAIMAEGRKKYILKNHEPVHEANDQAWLEWVTTHNREMLLAIDESSGLRIFTMFCGYENEDGDLFQTIVEAMTARLIDPPIKTIGAKSYTEAMEHFKQMREKYNDN